MWSRRNWPFTLHKTWHSNSTMRSQFSGQKVLLSFHCFEEPTVLHTIQVTKVLHQVSSTVLSCKQNKVIWLATHELLMIRDRFLTLCKGVFSEMITNVWKPMLVDQSFPGEQVLAIAQLPAFVTYRCINIRSTFVIWF